MSQVHIPAALDGLIVIHALRVPTNRCLDSRRVLIALRGLQVGSRVQNLEKHVRLVHLERMALLKVEVVAHFVLMISTLPNLEQLHVSLVQLENVRKIKDRKAFLHVKSANVLS